MSDPTTELAQGQRSEALKALRALQARMLVDVKPDQLAALSKEFRATLLELDSLPDTNQASTSDTLAARRQARLSNPAGSAPASRDAV